MAEKTVLADAGQRPSAPLLAKGKYDVLAEMPNSRDIVKGIRDCLFTKMAKYGRYINLTFEERKDITAFSRLLAKEKRLGDLAMLGCSVIEMSGYGEPHGQSYLNFIYLNKLLGNQRFIEASHFALQPVALMASNPDDQKLLYFHLDCVNTIANDSMLVPSSAKAIERMAASLSGNELTMAFHELIIRLRAERRKAEERSLDEHRRMLSEELRKIDSFDKASRKEPPLMVRKQA